MTRTSSLQEVSAFDVHSAGHIPVLLEAFVEWIRIDPDGRYVDATFGMGGHSRAILARLSGQGRLMALDRDPAAVEIGNRLSKKDPRFCMRHASFSDLGWILEQCGWDKVSGIGFDLGVSSPQLDKAERGFSFQKPGPLDMRMDPTTGQPLASLLRNIKEKELIRILREYGDERYAVRIAKAILRLLREDKPLTTRDLENAIFHAVPHSRRYGGVHPATRSFQALRIWVNDEFGQLQTGLSTAMDHLRTGGRLAAISFHSGEDRRVRDWIETRVHPCICPPDFPVCTCGRKASMRWVHKKPIRPSSEEIAGNPRSRSARLRIAEHL